MRALKTHSRVSRTIMLYGMSTTTVGTPSSGCSLRCSSAALTTCEARSHAVALHATSALDGPLQRPRAEREQAFPSAWQQIPLLTGMLGCAQASTSEIARVESSMRESGPQGDAVAGTPHGRASCPGLSMRHASAHRFAEQGLQLRHRPGDHPRDVEHGLGGRSFQLRLLLRETRTNRTGSGPQSTNTVTQERTQSLLIQAKCLLSNGTCVTTSFSTLDIAAATISPGTWISRSIDPSCTQ